jgi:Lon protease-like protein
VTLATYHLASLAPIGPADRFRLLAADGPKHRLDLLDEILDDVEAMLKFRLS